MSDEVEAKIHPGSDGKFWAEVLGCPGCYAQGDNYSKIMANLRDAHELWCTAPVASAAAPTSIPLVLPKAATVADLVTVLEAAGWCRADSSSESHHLVQQPASGIHLTLPADGSEGLNEGYAEAVGGFLRGTQG